MNARARMIAGGLVAIPVVLLALTSPAAAQHPIPESQRWATITHAGNAPHYDPLYNRSFGRVDYDYQISRTEVTGAEWHQFVLAYAPYVEPSYRYAIGFTGPWTEPSAQPDGSIGHELNPYGTNRATFMEWRFAARYANWLHNGKRATRDAFEDGVYDTSTFSDRPGLMGFTDQLLPKPGARYWIPSEDEWVKAAHFDPNRFGPGLPGYWEFPHQSNTPPRRGPPPTGQSSTGWSTSLWGPEPEVGFFPHAPSPWGLLDVSGGEREWLGTAFILPETGAPLGRRTRGSQWSGTFFPDRIGSTDWQEVSSLVGLRMARQVPTPGTATVAVLLSTTGGWRGQRVNHRSAKGAMAKRFAWLCRAADGGWVSRPRHAADSLVHVNATSFLRHRNGEDLSLQSRASAA